MLAVRKKLDDALPFIRDADLLLFRRKPGSVIGKLIATSGRSDYTHAAMCVWWPSERVAGGGRPPLSESVLMCVEVREFYGGRAVTLASQVGENPGLIDVFAIAGCAAEGYKRADAARHMLHFAGQPYGYGAIARAAAAYLPGVRFFYRTDDDDQQIDDSAVFCSEARVRADRLGGGIDPVPNLADRETEPGDLARSDVFRYQFTLDP
ncbi:MAG TPA: hypothetical protein VG826_29145 [Pirellulales bacterium]|nr:hypothetical protein [Pirellulales bacterium]